MTQARKDAGVSLPPPLGDGACAEPGARVAPARRRRPLGENFRLPSPGLTALVADQGAHAPSLGPGDACPGSPAASPAAPVPLGVESAEAGGQGAPPGPAGGGEGGSEPQPLRRLVSKTRCIVDGPGLWGFGGGGHISEFVFQNWLLLKAEKVKNPVSLETPEFRVSPVTQTVVHPPLRLVSAPAGCIEHLRLQPLPRNTRSQTEKCTRKPDPPRRLCLSPP